MFRQSTNNCSTTTSQQQEEYISSSHTNNMVRRSGVRCRCRPSSSRCFIFAAASSMMTFLLLTTGTCWNVANAYSVMPMKMMEYKPPVQTSVGKLLRSQRVPPKKDWKESLSEPSSSPLPPASSARGQSSMKNAAASGALMAPPETTSSTSFLPSMPTITPSSASFEHRMRDLVLRKRTSTDNSNRMMPANLRVVDTLQDYKTVVGDEHHKVVAVRFYAPWCKACKAVAPLYYHLANKYPNVVFVDVPVTERNTKLHQGLGVPTLPYAHIYHPDGGLVEELRLSRKFIPPFEQKLQSYVTGSCELISNDDNDGDNQFASPYKDDQESSTELR